MPNPDPMSGVAVSTSDLRDPATGEKLFAVKAAIAPAAGPIDVPADTPVVTVVRAFWDSPTIRAIRAMVIAAFSAASLAALYLVWTAGNIKKVDWSAVAFAFENAFVIGLAGLLFAWLKTRDNNPTNLRAAKSPDLLTPAPPTGG